MFRSFSPCLCLSFSVVYQVAVKVLDQHFSSLQQGLDLNETQMLMTLKHPNIVRLHEIIYENGRIHMVLERLESSLLPVIQNARKQASALGESRICSWVHQLLSALDYMHSKNIIHRDIKPENILVDANLASVKLSDFGLARKMDFSTRPGTRYISTLWYRSPELLLHSESYNEKMDMWALGAVMAELFTGSALFPGKDPLHQFQKICSILGHVKFHGWYRGAFMIKCINLQLADYEPIPLHTLVPNASRLAIDLLNRLLTVNPELRISAKDALKHAFFDRLWDGNSSSSGQFKRKPLETRSYRASPEKGVAEGKRCKVNNHNDFSANSSCPIAKASSNPGARQVLDRDGQTSGHRRVLHIGTRDGQLPMMAASHHGWTREAGAPDFARLPGDASRSDFCDMGYHRIEETGLCEFSCMPSDAEYSIPLEAIARSRTNTIHDNHGDHDDRGAPVNINYISTMEHAPVDVFGTSPMLDPLCTAITADTKGMKTSRIATKQLPISPPADYGEHLERSPASKPWYGSDSPRHEPRQAQPASSIYAPAGCFDLNPDF